MKILDQFFPNAFRFTFVRNPLDQFVLLICSYICCWNIDHLGTFFINKKSKLGTNNWVSYYNHLYKKHKEDQFRWFYLINTIGNLSAPSPAASPDLRHPTFNLRRPSRPFNIPWDGISWCLLKAGGGYTLVRGRAERGHRPLVAF